MLLLLPPLPGLALLISLAYLALGQGYNLGLKATPFSGIVFALAIPLIPLYAFAGVGRTLPVLVWLVPLGVLLGVTLNLANSLPDIEEDAATGTQTLAVVLGVKRSFFACRFLIVASALLMGILTAVRVVPARPLVILARLVFFGLAPGSMFFFFLPEETVFAPKIHFFFATPSLLVRGGGGGV